MKKRLVPGLFALAILPCCLLWWYRVAYFAGSAVPKGPAHTILFWNVSRGAMGWDAISREIHMHNPILVGLVEAGRTRDEVRKAWQPRFPEHTVKYLGRGMVVIARGEVIRTDNGPLASGGRFALCEVLLEQTNAAPQDAPPVGPVTVILVDIKSTPLMPRREPIAALTQLVAGLKKQPVLVMGDFNTPVDSVHLAGLRRNFVNAFEKAGRGFYTTWPVPLPVLSLDQVWANDKVSVRGCRLGWTWRSDHRPVISAIGFEE